MSQCSLRAHTGPIVCINFDINQNGEMAQRSNGNVAEQKKISLNEIMWGVAWLKLFKILLKATIWQKRVTILFHCWKLETWWKTTWTACDEGEFLKLLDNSWNTRDGQPNSTLPSTLKELQSEKIAKCQFSCTKSSDSLTRFPYMACTITDFSEINWNGWNHAYP